MKQLRVFSVLASSSVAVLLIAACGSSESVPKDSIAVVADQQVTRAEYDAMWEQAKASYKAQGRELPKAGTPEWTTLKGNIVQYLVQRAQFEQKAKELKIEVTDKEVDAQITDIKKQIGGEKKFEDQLKQSSLTLDRLKGQIRAKLIQDKIYGKVTADVAVTDKDVSAYYELHKVDQYGTPESRTVRHILVDKEARANDLYDQLRNGADFATLAKKYSKDTGSAAQGGKLTVAKGQTVPEFDKLAFSLKKGELATPVHSQYGWHVIQALSGVKPARTKPLAKVRDEIKAQLLSTKKDDAMAKWVSDVKKELGDKTTYQVGFTPPAENTATATQ
jgi:foldase protein PrsA